MSQEDTTPIVNEETIRPETTAEAAPEPQVTSTADEKKITELEKQVQEFKEGWQRERSDFANYKKRTEAQLKDSQQNATTQVLVNLLPIIDDFERAMGSIPAEFQGNPWLNGVTLIQRKFQKMLDENGVTVLDPLGDVFDPTRHEAVAMEDSDSVESGHVTTTLQKGYLRGDKVLRPAVVKVAN